MKINQIHDFNIYNETNFLEKLFITAILTIPPLIYMTYTWCAYFYNKTIDKLEELLDKLQNKL